MKKLMPLVALLLLLAGCTQGCGAAAPVETEGPGTVTPTPPVSARPTAAPAASATPEPERTPPPTPEQTPHPTPVQTAAVEPLPTPTAPPAAAETPPTTPEPTPVSTPEPTPEPEDPVPTDEEVLAAYRRAVEAFGWFQMSTMPTVPGDQVQVGDILYSRVDDPAITTLAGLRGYLKSLFSDGLVDELLPAGGDQYVDIEGALYVREGARGSDITKGGETLQVLRSGSAQRCTVRVTVEVVDPEADFAVVGTETHDFPYEKVGDRWIFTSFSLVR